MVKCKLCDQRFKFVTRNHLESKHNCKISEYVKRFGDKNVGAFPVLANRLNKDDPRYIRWKESLKKRKLWNKGYNKLTHPSIAKISETFKKKKIDNFKKWRERTSIDYQPFERSGDLAELIGVVLGDGHIGQFPRTEVLGIFSNSNNQGFIDRYAELVEQVFNKSPHISKRKNSNCVNIIIYQKHIGKRLGLPVGTRGNKVINIPQWIYKNKEYLVRYLRGLYEAEGSLVCHLPTYTHKFLFKNANDSLLDNVYRSLKVLGFHPHRSYRQIQISRKKEVYQCAELINFRKY